MIPLQLRKCLEFQRISRTVHPEHYRKRRLVSVYAARNNYRNDPQARYGEAAKSAGRSAKAQRLADLATVYSGTSLVTTTIPAKSVDTAEEGAIVLATQTSEHLIVVLTDS
ncbi:hypothetical protein MTO96_032607 [Rhipicephalus appendiculatus]